MKPRSLLERDCFARQVETHAQNYADGIAAIFEGKSVTWSDLNAGANRYAATLLDMGVTRGDVVSVFMENRIEFLESVIALNKIGATGGLINTNLRGRPLTHCISVTESKKCIFGAELAEAIQEVKSDLNLAEGSDYLFVPDGDLDSVPNWALNLETDSSESTPETFPSPMKSRSVIMPSTSSHPERRDYPRRPYCPIGVISRALCFHIPLGCNAIDRTACIYAFRFITGPAF